MSGVFPIAEDARRTAFNRLAEEWVEATKYFTSTLAMTQHPAFAELVAMGRSIIPWVLEVYAGRLAHGYWHLVLTEITGVALQRLPVKGDHLDTLRKAWLEWGSCRGN